MPMGKYSSFDACVKANSDKRDPEAYCGKIYWQTEGKKKHKKENKSNSFEVSNPHGTMSMSNSDDEVRLRVRLEKHAGHKVRVGNRSYPSDRVPHHHHKNYWHALRPVRKAIHSVVAELGDEESPDGTVKDQPYAVAFGPDNYKDLMKKCDVLIGRLMGLTNKGATKKQFGFPSNLVDHISRALAAVHGKEVLNPRYEQVCNLLRQALDLLTAIEREEESALGEAITVVTDQRALLAQS
jgi:hypothetical protein